VDRCLAEILIRGINRRINPWMRSPATTTTYPGLSRDGFSVLKSGSDRPPSIRSDGWDRYRPTEVRAWARDHMRRRLNED
jgi:hypothetical protein